MFWFFKADDVDGCSSDSIISCSLICARHGYKTGACIYQDKCYCFCRPHQKYNLTAGLFPSTADRFLETTSPSTDQESLASISISFSAELSLLNPPAVKIDKEPQNILSFLETNEYENMSESISVPIEPQQEPLLLNEQVVLDFTCSNSSNITMDMDIPVNYTNNVENSEIIIDTEIQNITAEVNITDEFLPERQILEESLSFIEAADHNYTIDRKELNPDRNYVKTSENNTDINIVDSDIEENLLLHESTLKIEDEITQTVSTNINNNTFAENFVAFVENENLTSAIIEEKDKIPLLSNNDSFSIGTATENQSSSIKTLETNSTRWTRIWQKIFKFLRTYFS